MCGIAGTWNIDTSEDAVRRVHKILNTRGPDKSLDIKVGNINFIHNRLSVLDVSDDGNQPMVSNCGRYIIVYNGEIYNHLELREEIGGDYVFKSTSDTETLLACYIIYGFECLHKLRGMFAFVIYDKIDDSLFAARDRMGVKPIYFYHEDNKFAFASRPSAVRELIEANNFEIEHESIKAYFHLGYIPGALSIYSNIRKIDPGCCIRVTNGSITSERYWSLLYNKSSFIQRFKNLDESELLNDVENKLTDSIGIRLRSDVPIGIFLSGGVDSSLIAALVKNNHSTSIPAFSIGSNDKSLDESKQSESIAKMLGLDYHRLDFNENAMEGVIENFFEAFDEPFCDTSSLNLIALSEFTRKHGVKVVLTGDGGDESFLGYSQYNYFSKISKYSNFLPSFIPQLVNHFFSTQSKFGLASKMMSFTTDLQRYVFMRSYLKRSPNLIRNCSIENVSNYLDNVIDFNIKDLKNDTSNKAPILDFLINLPDGYLQKADISSMAHSVEVRSPFMDYQFIEFAAALPRNLKVRNGISKFALKAILNRHIDYSSLSQDKKGFGVPIGYFLKTVLRSRVDDIFRDKDALNFYDIDKDSLSNMWSDFKAGNSVFESVIWNIFVFLNFARRRGGIISY
jgi:asparagine synthase (glutamine-hydrolysing)